MGGPIHTAHPDWDRGRNRLRPAARMLDGDQSGELHAQICTPSSEEVQIYLRELRHDLSHRALRGYDLSTSPPRHRSPGRRAPLRALHDGRDAFQIPGRLSHLLIFEEM